MSKIIDHTGQRFGKFFVLRRAARRNRAGTFAWVCRCDCGTVKTVSGPCLRRGTTKSCGCHRREAISARSFKHGHTVQGQSHSPEYRSWRAMLTRCTNRNGIFWHRYGGRGIRICERWASSFSSFFSDMGPRPSLRHSLDRKKNDLHYSCGKCRDCRKNGWKPNCRWATTSEQLNNTCRTRWISIDGKTDSVKNWAGRTKIAYRTILRRLDSGWSPEDAITRPVRVMRRAPLRRAF
jgi:hypothetical protein